MISTFKKMRIGIATLILMLFAGAQLTYAQEDKTVIDVVNENEEASVFADLLSETQLPPLLSQTGPFTVLAPSNEALEEMGDKLEEIKENPDQLENLVINHLFQGEVPAEEVEPRIGVPVKDGDFNASNGVVHIVNEVILDSE